MQYYDGWKANMGPTPDAACSNAYIANEKFLFNNTVDPASFATLINPQDTGYNCLIKFGETVVNVVPGQSVFIYAICTSPALEILQIDLEAQGGDALNNWSREYRRGLPASYAGIPRNGFDSLRNTCECPAGSKLHPNQEYCVKMPDIVIGFFNGVSNTRLAALGSKERLEAEYGDKYKDTPLKYDLFYNQTVNVLEDVAEVFEQRAQELDGVFANRWEVFWDILAGRHQADNSLTGRLLSLLGKGKEALAQLTDSIANALRNQLAAAALKLITLFKDSPTYENQAAHLARLTEQADRGGGLILVAHSQGNLFVNSAYDALLAAKPNVEAKVVHVAPASPTLRGQHILADIDLVINGLRVTGLDTVPPANVNVPFSKNDASGHGFEPTYMDKARNAYARTKELITNSLQALVP